MPNQVGQSCWKFLRTTFTVACLGSALGGALTHTVAGELKLAKFAGESSETEIEILRSDATSSRRGHGLKVRVVWSLPAFQLPVPLFVGNEPPSDAALGSLRNCCHLQGGQHALRNGLGAPLVT